MAVNCCQQAAFGSNDSTSSSSATITAEPAGLTNVRLSGGDSTLPGVQFELPPLPLGGLDPDPAAANLAEGAEAAAVELVQDPAQLALTAFQLAAECHVGHAYPRKAYEDRLCGNCNRPGIAGTAYPPQSVAPAAGSPPHALVVPMPSGLGQLGCDCVAQQQLQQRCGPVAARGPASAAQLHALQLAPAAGPARAAQLMPQQYRCILGFSHSAAQPGRVAGATARAAVRPLRLCCQHGAGRAPPPPPPSLSVSLRITTRCMLPRPCPAMVAGDKHQTGMERSPGCHC